MTDNEKAATFIGWQEGHCDLSKGDYRVVDCPHTGKHADCSRFVECHTWWICLCGAEMPCTTDELNHPQLGPNIHHDRAAPDMTDPRNYMKALEILSERRLEPDLGVTQGHWYVDTDTKGETELYAKTPAEAVILRLVALYDAEHQG